MIDWYWAVVAFYAGVSAGMWFILTIRDGRPWENLTAFLWPLMIVAWIATA